jgi:hypothetical protein
LYNEYNPPSVTTLVSLLRTTNLDNSSRVKVYNLLQNVHYSIPWRNFLKTKGIEDYNFKTPVMDLILRSVSTSEIFREVLLNQKGDRCILDTSITSHNIFKDKTFLTEAVYKGLQQITAIDREGSAVGPGELLFAILYDNVYNKTQGAGDLLVDDGKTLEMKGHLGRLGTQPSRGQYTTFIDSALRYKIESHIEAQTKSGSLAREFADFVHSKKSNDIADTLLYLRYELGTAYSESFIKELLVLIGRLYWDWPVDQYINDQVIREGKPSIRRALSKLNTVSYMTKIKADCLIFLKGSSGDFIVITSKTVDTIMDRELIKSDGFHKFKDPHPSMKVNYLYEK